MLNVKCTWMKMSGNISSVKCAYGYLWRFCQDFLIQCFSSSGHRRCFLMTASFWVIFLHLNAPFCVLLLIPFALLPSRFLRISSHKNMILFSLPLFCPSFSPFARHEFYIQHSSYSISMYKQQHERGCFIFFFCCVGKWL